MADLEPFIEAPFESAPNRPFRALLVLGIVLVVLVGLVGRSTVTTTLVVGYLLAIPAYVAYRIRTWDADEAGSATDGDETAAATDEDGADG